MLPINFENVIAVHTYCLQLAILLAQRLIVLPSFNKSCYECFLLTFSEKFWISYLRPYFCRILSWCNELRTATLLSDSVGVKIQEICVSHNSLSLVWNFFVLNEIKTVCRWTRRETSVIEVVRFVTRWVVYH